MTRKSVSSLAAALALFSVALAYGHSAHAKSDELCLFGEKEGARCVGPESSFYENEGGENTWEAAAVGRVLATLSPLRMGMTAEQAIEAVGRPPLKDVPAAKIGFSQVDLDGTYRFLVWEREVEFLEHPLQLFATLEDDSLIAVWMVPRSANQFYAESIALTDCDAFTAFLKARYGPEGTIVQLDDALFDHSTNVYEEGGAKWKPETRNVNTLAGGKLWLAYHTVFTKYSDFKLNGVHHDYLEACRSQVMVVRRE